MAESSSLACFLLAKKRLKLIPLRLLAIVMLPFLGLAMCHISFASVLTEQTEKLGHTQPAWSSLRQLDYAPNQVDFDAFFAE